MVRREDVLRELGLAPTWRLRRAAGGGPPIVDEQRPAPATNESTVESQDTQARRARIASLDGDRLPADIAACTACGLCKSRRRTVPGVGDLDAQWMFIGEAPGADEDAQGEPFVGAAGQLLDNMLAALGLDRTRNVYIANVLKCRPPNNRTPAPGEAEACAPYLDRQIELIAPRMIIALGKSAACRLLGVDAPVASLRNRVHRYRDTSLVVTYHPAYLLRTPVDKAKAWEDLLLARRALRDRLAASTESRV
jgi:uracil-DNA glycosylase